MTALQPPAPPPTPSYCTVIPERRPKTKVHTALGHAKNAISTRSRYVGSVRLAAQPGDRWPRYRTTYRYPEAALYEWDSEAREWRLLYDVQRGATSLPWHENNEEVTE